MRISFSSNSGPGVKGGRAARAGRAVLPSTEKAYQERKRQINDAITAKKDANKQLDELRKTNPNSPYIQLKDAYDVYRNLVTERKQMREQLTKLQAADPVDQEKIASLVGDLEENAHAVSKAHRAFEAAMDALPDASRMNAEEKAAAAQVMRYINADQTIIAYDIEQEHAMATDALLSGPEKQDARDNAAEMGTLVEMQTQVADKVKPQLEKSASLSTRNIGKKILEGLGQTGEKMIKLESRADVEERLGQYVVDVVSEMESDAEQLDAVDARAAKANGNYESLKTQAQSFLDSGFKTLSAEDESVLQDLVGKDSAKPQELKRYMANLNELEGILAKFTSGKMSLEKLQNKNAIKFFASKSDQFGKLGMAAAEKMHAVIQQKTTHAQMRKKYKNFDIRNATDEQKVGFAIQRGLENPEDSMGKEHLAQGFDKVAKACSKKSKDVDVKAVAAQVKVKQDVDTAVTEVEDLDDKTQLDAEVVSEVAPRPSDDVVPVNRNTRLLTSFDRTPSVTQAANDNTPGEGNNDDIQRDDSDTISV